MDFLKFLTDLLGGAAGAALVTAVFALISSRSKRRDAHNKALRYLMLFVIQERAKEHLQSGIITLEDRRSLHHWHDLYHNGLGGNGDADALMSAVDKLPINTEE